MTPGSSPGAAAGAAAAGGAVSRTDTVRVEAGISAVGAASVDDATTKASAWLDNKLRDLRAQVEAADDRLAEYARANGIVFVSQSQTLVTERLAQLQAQLTTAQADRMGKEALYDQVKSGHIDTLPGVVDNQLVQNLESHKTENHRGDVAGVTWRLADVRDPALAGRLTGVDVLVHTDVDLGVSELNPPNEGVST